MILSKYQFLGINIILYIYVIKIQYHVLEQPENLPCIGLVYNYAIIIYNEQYYIFI